MGSYITKIHPILWDAIDPGEIIFIEGLNLIAGTNGTGKSQVLKYIQDHLADDNLVTFNAGHTSRIIVPFSPKRNAQKLLFESFELPAGFTTQKKQQQIQEMLANQINADGFQTIRPIAEYLSNTAESLINTQGYNKSDAAKAVLDEYREIVKSIFPRYDLNFDWDNESTRYKASLRKNGFDIPLNDISEGENALLSLSFAMNYSRNDVDVFLIDEPEVHLNWSLETRLFKFMSEFCHKHGKQIISATHSQAITLPPYNRKTLYLYWDGKDLKTTSAPDKRLRDDLISQSSKILEEAIKGKKLVLYSEGGNIDYIKKAVELYLPKKLELIEFVDSVNNQTGKDQLIIYFGYQKEVDNNISYLFVWDCDAKKTVDKLTEERNVFKYLFVNNRLNNKVNAGIENLFPKNRFTQKYYTKIKEKKYGGTVEIFDKSIFQKDTLTNANKTNYKMFKPLIKKIESLL